MNFPLAGLETMGDGLRASCRVVGMFDRVSSHGMLWISLLSDAGQTRRALASIRPHVVRVSESL